MVHLLFDAVYTRFQLACFVGATSFMFYISISRLNSCQLSSTGALYAISYHAEISKRVNEFRWEFLFYDL